MSVTVNTDSFLSCISHYACLNGQIHPLRMLASFTSVRTQGPYLMCEHKCLKSAISSAIKTLLVLSPRMCVRELYHGLTIALECVEANPCESAPISLRRISNSRDFNGRALMKLTNFTGLSSTSLRSFGKAFATSA